MIQPLKVKHHRIQNHHRWNQLQVPDERGKPLGHRVQLNLEAQPVSYEDGRTGRQHITDQLQRDLDLATALNHEAASE